MKPIPFNAFAKLFGQQHLCQTLIGGVAIDSRQVESGDVFFALPGERVDGHQFIDQAARRGAVGVVVCEDFKGEAFGLPKIYVPDVLDALQEFARQSLAKRTSQVIAITGSLGKTTCKEWVAAFLRTRYRVFASPRSYNSQATVPLSILQADEKEDYLVLEMGMSQPGEIAKLISIAPPAMALLTNVSVQHANNFSDGLKGIRREKGMIFSHSRTKMGLLPSELSYFDEIYQSGSCPKKTFSTSNTASHYYLNADALSVHIEDEDSVEIKCALPNPVHYSNLLAAIALARWLEIPWSSIQEIAAQLKLPSMRFEKVIKQGIIFINDAYNANPDSMKAALENLPAPEPKGKVVAVLGDMDALGSYTEEGHMLVAKIALEYADHLLCLGPRWKAVLCIEKETDKPIELYNTRSELADALQRLVQPGDVVLLKGARAHALERILEVF